MAQARNKHDLSVWLVAEDGLTGTENQCLGVVAALGTPHEIKRFTLRQPWKSLSPYLGFEQKWSFEPSFSAPWPDLVIASGRKAVSVCRYIKKKNPKTYCVFLQNPKSRTNIFDLIAAPAHDELRGQRVIQTVGAPNSTGIKILEKPNNPFKENDKINIAILIGGKSKAHSLPSALMHHFIQDIAALDGNIFITASRRTGSANLEMLKTYPWGDHVRIWDGRGENPYTGMLAHADYIFCTNDSVSMLSDAGSTGKPVYMFSMDGGAKKFDKFYETLITKGIARPFEGRLEHWNYEPLHDAQTVADEITKRMNLK